MWKGEFIFRIIRTDREKGSRNNPCETVQIRK